MLKDGLQSSEQKTAYVAGPLTELPANRQVKIKAFYVSIADLCLDLIGVRAFVPHEYFDPWEHKDFTPQEVDRVERQRVSKLTSCLIVVAIGPSWGGGIEVEIARTNRVPVILLIKKGKRVSRLLRGNPAVKVIIEYTSEEDALRQLRVALGMIFLES